MANVFDKIKNAQDSWLVKKNIAIKEVEIRKLENAKTAFLSSVDSFSGKAEGIKSKLSVAGNELTTNTQDSACGPIQDKIQEGVKKIEDSVNDIMNQAGAIKESIQADIEAKKRELNGLREQLPSAGGGAS